MTSFGSECDSVALCIYNLKKRLLSQCDIHFSQFTSIICLSLNYYSTIHERHFSKFEEKNIIMRGIYDNIYGPKWLKNKKREKEMNEVGRQLSQ